MFDHLFPNLSKEGYKITSQPTPSYNCIAWAAGDGTRWWEPDSSYFYYWPEDVLREYTMGAYLKAFFKLGYEICDNSEIEIGFEKVAIYIDTHGNVTHAARQLTSGKWTSKLGQAHDIEHTLFGLVSQGYGTVGQIIKRKMKL